MSDSRPTVARVVAMVEATRELVATVDRKLAAVDEKHDMTREELSAIRADLKAAKETVTDLQNALQTGDQPIIVQLGTALRDIADLREQLKSERRARITVERDRITARTALVAAAIAGLSSIGAATVALLK